MNDNIQNSFSYLCHLQKIFHDYEKLQLQYAKLRQQFNERKIVTKHEHHTINDNNNKTVDDLKYELECEKTIVKSLNAEICHLLKEGCKVHDKYSDLLAITQVDKQNKNDFNQNYTEDKFKSLENENKELKENLEFISSENTVLSDSLKDLEELIFKERKEWIEEKNKYQEVVTWSKSIYDKIKIAESNNEKLKVQLDDYKVNVEELKNQLDLFDSFLEKFHQYLLKNNLVQKDILVELSDCDKVNKIEKYQKILENTATFSRKNDESNNICETESSLKSEISSFYKEIDVLKESNKCLLSENEELKKIHNEGNFSNDNVALNLEIVNLKEKLKCKEEMIEKISQKFARNRSVWEANEKKSTEEFEKLDNFISLIINKLNDLSIDLKQSPEIDDILKLIDCENKNN